MASRIKSSNIIFGLLLLAGLAGALYEAYQYWQIERLNQAISTDGSIDAEAYPYQRKFAAAYQQGKQHEYKHAIQTYSQLLETKITDSEQARIQFNIANNLFAFGLIRKINDDGTLADEAKYAFSQAKLAYEQSLRLEPAALPAKLNLSLLNSVLPKNMQNRQKEQSGMELSNLPIGLP